MGLLHRRQIDRSKLAATIDFQLELEPVTFVERRHARALYGTDMYKGIGLAVIALNEAEALHRIEELDRTGRLFARQLTLRTTGTGAAAGGTRASITIARRAAVFDRERFAIDLQVGCGNPAATVDQREAKGLPFGQAGQASLLDSADMDENIFAAIIANDEAEALLSIEKLDDARAFANDLGRHTASTAAAGRAAEAATAAAAETAAAAATAEAITAATKPVAATAAEAITAATETVATAEPAVETAFAEAIAFVFATPATIAAAPFIETHALFVFPVRP